MAPINNAPTMGKFSWKTKSSRKRKDEQAIYEGEILDFSPQPAESRRTGIIGTAEFNEDSIKDNNNNNTSEEEKQDEEKEKEKEKEERDSIIITLNNIDNNAEEGEILTMSTPTAGARTIAMRTKANIKKIDEKKVYSSNNNNNNNNMMEEDDDDEVDDDDEDNDNDDGDDEGEEGDLEPESVHDNLRRSNRRGLRGGDSDASTGGDINNLNDNTNLTSSDSPQVQKKVKIHTTGMYQCIVCGKMYKHRNCLSKHAWEHHESWTVTKKWCQTKHQQVQMLEAAQVLSEMNLNAKIKMMAMIKETNVTNPDHDKRRE